MQRAGEVRSIAQGLLVVRCFASDPPSIGARVVDERLEQVGTVVDVFGPVDRPYLAVSPTGSPAPAGLIGERLYVREDR